MEQNSLDRTSVAPRGAHNLREELERIVALRKEGKLEVALQAVVNALIAKPRAAPLHAEHGILLERLGRIPDAAAAAATAAGLQPNNAVLQNRASTLLSRAGHHERALAFSDAAVALDANTAAFQVQRSRVLDLLERNDEAIAAAEKALALGAGNPRIAAHVDHLKARAAAREKTGAPARTDLYPARDLEDTIASAQELAKSGSFEEALLLTDQALAMAPRRADLHLLRSNVLDSLGLLSEAVAAAHRAMELSPRDPQIVKHHVRLVARQHSGEPEPEPAMEPSGSALGNLFRKVSAFVRSKLGR